MSKQSSHAYRYIESIMFAVIVPKAILMEEIRNKTRSLVCLKMTSEVDLEPMWGFSSLTHKSSGWHFQKYGHKISLKDSF